MTKRQLSRITLLVMAVYTGAVMLGVVLRILDNTPNGIVYSTYKDLLSLIIAIPAAFLAYSFQRRNSYVQALRSLWSDLVAAVQAARSYTCVEKPSQELHLETLSKLSAVIEEARGVFSNIPAQGAPNGWYPFEPIKEIHNDVKKLGYGDNVSQKTRGEVGERINKRWKLVRTELLKEFDRCVPTYHHAWYTNLMNRNTPQDAPADAPVAASRLQGQSR